MTVVLRITRSSGSTEIHHLPSEGDHVDVPRGLLIADDVLGFDVELAGSDGHDFDLEVASSGKGGCEGAREALG